MTRAYVRRAAALVVILALGTAGERVLQAQPPEATKLPSVSVRLSPAQAAAFQEALKSLSAQAKVAFVAEGAPLQPALPEGKAPDLSGGLPLEAAVMKLAAAYDYDSERRGGVFVLKKRYTNPNDLPGVTLDECILSLKDVVHVMSPHAPPVPAQSKYRGVGPNTDLLLDVMQTLSPEQVQAMKSGTLRVASLGPRPRAQVRRMAMHLYVGSKTQEAQAILTLIRQASQGALKRKVYGGVGKPVFGYEVVDPYGRDIFRPLEVAPHQGDPLPGSEFAPPDLKALASAGHTTLGAVIDGLNKRGKSSLAVDEALAPKPVIVAGLEAAAPAQVLEALASAYGLRVKSEKDGTSRLTRRLFRAVSGPAALPASVRHSLPQPLLRALRDGVPEAAREEFDRLEASTEVNSAALKQALTRYQQANDGREALPRLILQEVTRRLLFEMRPALEKAGPEGGVPVASLSEGGKSALATFLMTDLLMSLSREFRLKAPVWVTRFDDLYVYGGPYERNGKKKLSFWLGMSIPQADGRIRGGGSVGIFDVNLPAEQ